MRSASSLPLRGPRGSATDHVYRLGSIVRVPYHGSLARITLSLGLARKVRTILEHEHFDIIHVHEPLLPMLPLVTLAQSRAVTIGTFHASWKQCRFYALGRPALCLSSRVSMAG